MCLIYFKSVQPFEHEWRIKRRTVFIIKDKLYQVKMNFIRRAKFDLVLIFLLYFVSVATPQDSATYSSMTIILNRTIQYNNREIYGEFIKLKSSSTTQVSFTNINPDFGFIVFQVHSQFDSLILYANNDTNLQIKGTNLGLVSELKKVPKNQIGADIFYIENPVNTTVLVYASVHGYLPKDPYPGGCNMEFRVKQAPFLNVTTLNDYIIVDAASASVDSECKAPNSATVTFYMMYLPEMNFYADDYFNGIRRMMALKTIEKYAVELPQTSVIWKMRRFLSAYHSTGVIFVAIARNNLNNSLYSIYVPNHSYGCRNIFEVDCIFPDEIVSPLLCALLLFVGIFVSYFGHRFFKTEMFLAGFFCGFIVTYVLVDTVDQTALLAASALSGVFFGAIWLLFWWLYGIPAIAVLLPSLNVGFIVAAIFYYRLPANVIYLQDDLNFWSLFVMIMTLTAMAMIFVPYSGNILCCALLGGFCTMFAFDHFLGANQRYIIVNTLRRAVVPYFKYAVLSPPFQWRDFLVTMVWVIITISGWVIQHWDNRGRVPFPPPPRSMRAVPPGPAYGALSAGQVRHMSIREQMMRSHVVGTVNERTYLLGSENPSLRVY